MTRCRPAATTRRWQRLSGTRRRRRSCGRPGQTSIRESGWSRWTIMAAATTAGAVLRGTGSRTMPSGRRPRVVLVGHYEPVLLRADQQLRPEPADPPGGLPQRTHFGGQCQALLRVHLPRHRAQPGVVAPRQDHGHDCPCLDVHDVCPFCTRSRTVSRVARLLCRTSRRT